MALLFLSSCFSFYTCAPDATNEDSVEAVVVIEKEEAANIIANITEAPKMNIDSSVILIESDVKDIEIQEERAEYIRQAIDTSNVRKEFGQDCAAILAKYTKVINKYAETGDDSILDEILDWQNDAIFISCNKKEEYKVAFQKLNEILE
jgi:hypothetical protein